MIEERERSRGKGKGGMMRNLEKMWIWGIIEEVEWRRKMKGKGNNYVAMIKVLSPSLIHLFLGQLDVPGHTE